MKESHKDVIQKIFDTASMQLAEEGKVNPIYFIVKDDYFKPIMADPNRDFNIKEYSSAITNIAHETNADAVIFISEQFTVHLEKTDPRKQALLEGLIKPSDQPDKKESLVVSYIRANGNTTSLFGTIITNISSQVRYIKESKWMSNVKTSLIPAWRDVPKDS